MQTFACQSYFTSTSFSTSCIHFFKEILLISTSPLSKVKYYAIRIEFQVRGSPHVHSFMRVLNPPLLLHSTINSFIEYLETVVSANLPCKQENWNCSILLKIIRFIHTLGLIRRTKTSNVVFITVAFLQKEL